MSDIRNKNFENSTGKRLFESLFDKVEGLQPCNFFKKRLQHRCFPVKFAKFLRTPILKNICKRPLLIERTPDVGVIYFNYYLVIKVIG